MVIRGLATFGSAPFAYSEFAREIPECAYGQYSGRSLKAKHGNRVSLWMEMFLASLIGAFDRHISFRLPDLLSSMREKLNWEAQNERRFYRRDSVDRSRSDCPL